MAPSPREAQGSAAGIRKAPFVVEPQGIATALQLATISEIGARITACSTIAEVLQAVVSEARWLITFGRCTLAIVMPGGDQFQVHAPDTAGEVPPPATFALAEGAIGRVLTHQQSVQLDDPAAAWTDNPVGRASLLPAVRSLLILPLFASGRMIGTLNFSAASPHAYSTGTVSVARLLALQVGSAVRNALLLDELDGSENVILSLAHAIEAKDPYTEGHCQRLAEQALRIGQALNFSPAHLRDLRMAAMLHDVGKIAVPESILRKPGRLTEEEYLLMQQHPVVGVDICAPLRSARACLQAIHHHHERWDGRGYPHGLAGEAIPVDARIIAILDAYDAMTSDRPYRPGMAHERACAILRENVGPQWDPRLVGLFLGIVDAERALSGVR